MTTSVMVNFRTRPEFLKAIDQAAAYTGRSRSEFLRIAVERAVEQAELLPQIRIADDSKAKEKHAQDKGEIEEPTTKETCEHPKESLARTAWGTKICQACGLQFR